MKGVGKNLYLKTEFQAPEVMWAVTSPASGSCLQGGCTSPHWGQEICVGSLTACWNFLFITSLAPQTAASCVGLSCSLYR